LQISGSNATNLKFTVSVIETLKWWESEIVKWQNFLAADYQS
jgi:hypothetical protein